MAVSEPLPALLLSFLLTVVCVAGLLPWLRSLRIRKEVRIDTPESHQAKQGTPGMGGIALLIGILLAILALHRSAEGLLLAVTTLFFGGIGFWDDYAKATGRENRGVKARHKLSLQCLGSLAFLFAGTRGSHLIAMPSGTVTLWSELGFFAWATFVIIATCNAANITDGLDGLAAGLTVISATALGAIAIFLNQPATAGFCAALAGGAGGFLVFNARKALIFMGDTGSLAIGAGLATSALLLRCELLLPFIALPFVIDMLSVILQVVSFKTTGKRIFRMAPLHHGLELRGWSEWRIVITSWIVGVVAAAGTLLVWKSMLNGQSMALWR